jgi:hypothetical protein
VQRLEKLCQRADSGDAEADRWLARHHPETLERLNRLHQIHRGNTDMVVRALSMEDLDNLIDALNPEHRAERARWKALIERLRPLISDDEYATIAKFLLDKFELNSTAWRWPVATYSFLSACPPALRGAAIAALIREHSGPMPWLHTWLLSVVRIESRLPPDVQPECIDALVQAHITTNSNWWDMRICNGCGLLRPMSIQVCPHCPANGQPLAGDDWRTLGESELLAFEWEGSDGPSTARKSVVPAKENRRRRTS